MGWRLTVIRSEPLGGERNTRPINNNNNNSSSILIQSHLTKLLSTASIPFGFWTSCPIFPSVTSFGSQWRPLLPLSSVEKLVGSNLMSCILPKISTGRKVWGIFANLDPLQVFPVVPPATSPPLEQHFEGYWCAHWEGKAWVIKMWNSLAEDVVMATGTESFKRGWDNFMEGKCISD